MVTSPLRMQMFRGIPLSSFLFLLSSVHVGALAQVDSPAASTASDAFDRARTLLADQRPREALSEYLSIYDLTGSLRAYYGMVQSERALGAWVDAYVHVVDLLSRGPDAWLDEGDRRARIAEGRDEIRRHVGALVVFVEPIGARVFVDGLPVEATSQAPLALTVGSHRVHATAEGYTPSPESVVEVLPSEPGEGPLSLAVATLTLVEAPLEPEVPGTSERGVESPRVPWSPRERRRFGARLLLGGSGVAVGASALVLGARMRAAQRWNDDTRCDRVMGIRRSAECPDEASILHWTRVASPVGWVSAGLFAAGGTALLATLRDESATEAEAVACTGNVGGGRIGVLCAGRF